PVHVPARRHPGPGEGLALHRRVRWHGGRRRPVPLACQPRSVGRQDSLPRGHQALGQNPAGLLLPGGVRPRSPGGAGLSALRHSPISSRTFGTLSRTYLILSPVSFSSSLRPWSAPGSTTTADSPDSCVATIFPTSVSWRRRRASGSSTLSRLFVAT